MVIIAVLAWLFLRKRKNKRVLHGLDQVQEPAMDTQMQQPRGASKGRSTEYYAYEASPGFGRTELDEERARQGLA
jgi:hypothetical protein